MFKDILLLTLKGIVYRKLRSWLTILGIILGVMLVVVIISLGDGIQRAVTGQMQKFGTNLIMIFPGEDTNPFLGIIGGQKFNEEDLLALEKIEGVDFVLPVDIAAFNVEFKGEKKSVMTHGATWKKMIRMFEDSEGLKLEEGKWPDNDQSSEVVFGYLAYKKLFKDKIKIGDDVLIKSKKMKVVGYISEIGNRTDDNFIYISLSNFENFTGVRGRIGTAITKTNPGTDNDLIGRQIKFQLNKQEHVKDFSILTPQKANNLIGGVLNIIEIFLMMIALTSLLVGAVGITNTMYTSVLERTKQIGIMKAIGADKDAILTLFLIESGVIGLVGGLIGILFGLFFSYGVGIFAESKGIIGLFSFVSVDYIGLLVILSITFITGIISGILPAMQASNLEAAEALRYE